MKKHTHKSFKKIAKMFLKQMKETSGSLQKGLIDHHRNLVLDSAFNFAKSQGCGDWDSQEVRNIVDQSI